MTAAVTWWGHSSMSIELEAARVATDPLLTRRLFHLRRSTLAPPAAAAVADVVLISHQHHDHLHLPSLARFDPAVPIVVPRGAARLIGTLGPRRVIEVVPGDTVEVVGVQVSVLAATHDGRRHGLARHDAAPALGFRFTDGRLSCWYPGDTGPREDFGTVAPVDLAAVPIGGWGPTLGEEHLGPQEAAAAVSAVGARWALGVHYGTFWPIAMQRLHPASHRRLFVDPPEQFRRAVREAGANTQVLTPEHAVRVPLAAGSAPG